ncbi:MAG TPA: PAS domain-containing protein [Thermoanaerobaculia bacterium]|jgi:PAS domain S-box-containing protein|nr:PAS domain-containing protein [Thermoanaerobaculia bacterium]
MVRYEGPTSDATSIGRSLSLSKVEALYGGLIEALPAIVYVAEPFPPYQTIYVSPRIEELGFGLQEWLSREDAWVSILHPEDRARVLLQSGEALRNGVENDFEYRVIARDGEVRWIHDRGRFIADRDGCPICWQGVMLDVTAKKKAEEEREALLEELKKTFSEIRALTDLLPVCSSCKRVRNDKDYWEALDRYLTIRSAAKLTHGVCPDCAARA